VPDPQVVALVAFVVSAVAVFACGLVLLWESRKKAPKPVSDAPSPPLLTQAMMRDAALLGVGLGLAVGIIAAGWGAWLALQWLWAASPLWIIGGVGIPAAAYVGLRLHAREQARLREQEAIIQRRRVENAQEVQRERERFAQGQRRAGLVPVLGQDGRERWLTPPEAEAFRSRELASEDEALVRASLQAFQPSMRHDYELPYHMELLGFLRARIPAAEPELQVGSSRPDIVVGHVAIEVKGPTDMAALQTVADKCVRYAQHFAVVIVVLFDVQVSERMYAEWESGIVRAFPHVTLLRKPPTRGPASYGSYAARTTR
jgi:hypothetical protein